MENNEKSEKEKYIETQENILKAKGEFKKIISTY